VNVPVCLAWIASGPLWALFGLALYLLLHLGLCLRIVMQRRPVGESLAWIFIIFAMPFLGPAAYLVLGELRLGRRRALRAIHIAQPIRELLEELPGRSRVDWSRTEHRFKSLAEMSWRTIGVPAMGRNHVELIDSWQQAFARLIDDIDQAQSTVHLEFYIWNEGGEADAVAAALGRARARGVVCRVLVDDMGSYRFLRGAQAAELRSAGVDVQSALPGGLWRVPFVRIDLRMHRKIVVVDGRIAYTGSLNLVDPRYFKQDAGVGQWVDAMVRIEGPAVEPLAITFLSDWFVESDDQADELSESGDLRPQPARGQAIVQVLPSGPGIAGDAVEHVLLTAVYSARSELVLTTPYFVPSDPLRMGLVAAARRGVKVIVVVPARVDSRLVRYASRALQGELMEAGVRIAAFGDGLLHTKSVTIDGEHCLFGSVNLDPRSFRLNFEILLAIYDRPFAERLRALQQSYIDRSELVDLQSFRQRSQLQQGIESLARLASPVL